MATEKKMVSLAALIETVRSARDAGETVVQCHGVFDLLHIGHIRYLEQAKKLGDRLVVTVTPDRYVNKGPTRPAFPQNTRAAALAALSCVDHVAVNDWPTAAETIQALRPHIYAKGAEFKENRTPEILAEEEAAKAVGAEIRFVEDVTSSSSELINRYLSPFDEETQEYLARMRAKYKPGEALSFLQDARDCRVLVVGETIIDEYYYCKALGRSSKAPVVAMQYQNHEKFAGGAAAIANHLAGLCDHVGLLSMVGTDGQEDWLRSQLKPSVLPVFPRKSDSPTITKRRYRESYFGQPVFEVYWMNDDPLSPNDNKQLCNHLHEMIGHYDLVVVADYGHSMITPAAVDLLTTESAYLAVNTQVNAGNVGYHTISKYPRADYFCIAINELQLECRSHSSDVRPLLKSVAEKLSARRATVTRGKAGSITYSSDGSMHEAPTVAAKVVDRVGAGDAVLAITSLCAVREAPLDIQAFLGNVAGAEATATVGNKDTLDLLRLRRHIEALLK